jgi:hypothetical protein
MTTERDFDRITRAWLDTMPDEAPDRTIAAVLEAVATAPQRRRPRIGLPWRSPMNRLTILAATAALLVVALGGAMLFASGRVPVAQPTPVPTATPVIPSSAPSGAALAAPADDTLWGDWISEVPPIPEIQMPAGMIQLSIDWEFGEEVWLQTIPDYRQLLSSTPLAAPSGELHVRSNSSNTQCQLNSVGRYAWDRVPSGRFLHLTLIDDACPTRAKVFARTWVRSHGAVSDGGSGVAYSTTPMVQVDLPRGQRLGASAGEQWQEIKTFGGEEPFQAFVVIANPGGFNAPCSTSDTEKIDIAHTTDALVAYLDGLPGASHITEPTEIDGRPAVQIDYRIDNGVSCASGEIAALHPQDASDPQTWTSIAGELQRMYAVQVDADTTFLLWYQGNSETERSVIESIQFIDALPLP